MKRKPKIDDKRFSRIITHNGQYFKSGFGSFSFPSSVGHSPVMFDKPNIIALYLSIAEKSQKSATRLIDKRIIPNLKLISKSPHYIIDIPKYYKIAFNLLEKIITSVIFSYTSVEAFTNAIIPHNYFELRKIDGTQRRVDYIWLQRNLKLLEKIKKVIPKAYNFKFDANKLENWSHFTDLEKYRDELVHLKQEFIILNENGSLSTNQIIFLQNFIGDFLTRDIVKTVKEILKYISNNVGSHMAVPYEFQNNPIEYSSLGLPRTKH